MNGVLRHLREAALLAGGEGRGDTQLLESFVARRDEAAFAALLRRHGPMVLAVCRRVLGNVHDAEDAFQATFLVLARKAGSLRSRELLANWLYGVAHRTALKARAMNAKRRAHERRAGAVPRSAAAAEGPSDELLAELDTALNRLPDKYRTPIVLCELEGKRRREVARLLGVPEGTVAWRLAHAKKLLARRLSRHGAALSAGAVAALLSRDAASACVPAALVRATVRAAALTAGVVSAGVVALTEGVMKAMLLSKLKLVWAVALAGALGAGAVGLTYRPAAAQSEVPRHGPPVSRASDELEELRLEVAALRRGLESMRARVKALEDGARQPQGHTPHAGANRPVPDALPKTEHGGAPKGAARTDAALPSDHSLPHALGSKVPEGTARPDAAPGRPRDPLAEAWAALATLQQHPDDPRAERALADAVRRLKEQARGGAKPETRGHTQPDPAP